MNSKFHLRFLIGAFAALAMSGCATFTKTQTSLFVDEDSNVISVEYGTRSKDHVFDMVSPGNGQPMEFSSKLMVRVLLPNGDRITAYRCFNPIPVGTMYMTDDEHWKYLANGFNCTIYEQLPDKSDYVAVFDGVLSKGSGDE